MQPSTRALLGTTLLGACLAAGPVLADPPTRKSVSRPAPVLRHGERLFYRASAWKGPISSNVGTATLSVQFAPPGTRRPGWSIVARASGSSMGRTMNSTVVSTFDTTGKRLRRYEEINRGSRQSARRLEFGAKELRYSKVKHCTGCTNRKHFDGDAHCTDHGCGEYGHRVWRLRHRHAADVRVVDPLSALYAARGLDLREGGPARVLRIWAGHGIFDVTIRVVGRESCTVPAGTFDALRLELDPRPAPGIPNTQRFRGLFGMSGKITLLVDAARKIPLLIRGVIPIGVDINAEVVLTKIQEPVRAKKPVAATRGTGKAGSRSPKAPSRARTRRTSKRLLRWTPSPCRCAWAHRYGPPCEDGL